MDREPAGRGVFLNKAPTFLLSVALLTGAAALSGCGGDKRPPACPMLHETPTPLPSGMATPKGERLASENPVVKGVGLIEHYCGRELFSGAMQFFDIPLNAPARQQAVAWQPAALQQQANVYMQPTVILEPKNMPLNKNMPEEPLREYCMAMKHAHVTDKELGQVVVLPEIKQGSWKDVDTDYYGANVTKQLRVLKEYFPKVQGGILIDTHPYELNEVLASLLRNKDNPEKALDTSLLSFVGIQAYTNTARVKFKKGKADISGYLSVDVMHRVAAATGNKDLVIVTGIAKEDRNQGTKYSIKQRIAIAEALVGVVGQAKRAGMHVTRVVLFTENKPQERRNFGVTGKKEAEIVGVLHDGLSKLGVELSGFNP